MHIWWSSSAWLQVELWSGVEAMV